MEKETFVYTSYFLNEVGEKKLKAWLAEFWDGEVTDMLVSAYSHGAAESAGNSGVDCAGVEIPSHKSTRKRVEYLALDAADFDVETTQETL